MYVCVAKYVTEQEQVLAGCLDYVGHRNDVNDEEDDNDRVDVTQSIYLH